MHDQAAEAQPGRVDFVGTRIRDIRAHAGRSIEEIARAAGIEPAVLEAIESGAREPTARELMRIAEGLGVPVSQIFGPLSPAALLFAVDFGNAPDEVQTTLLGLLRENENETWRKA